MYPISVQEVLSIIPPLELDRTLSDFLRFGMYPEVIVTPIQNQKEEIVRELAGSYLLKDILDFDKILYPGTSTSWKNPLKIAQSYYS